LSVEPEGCSHIPTPSMKYGLLFAFVSILLLAKSTTGGAAVVLLWPALSFAIVASGYLILGPVVFGKDNGRLPRLRVVLLLPYLLFLWSVWHVLRKLKSENAFDHVCDGLIVGRRLLPEELPEIVDLVIDLTCEFNECDSVRGPRYLCLPILDATAPKPELLSLWIEEIAQETGATYVHCAECGFRFSRTPVSVFSGTFGARIAFDFEAGRF
jgi:hypothetical protein